MTKHAIQSTFGNTGTEWETEALAKESVIMSDSKELRRVVEHLLRRNNVRLKDSFQNVLEGVTDQFYAAGLIPKMVVDSTYEVEVDNYTLASRLLNACHPLLVQYPEDKFLKFIQLLKGYETMKQLATEMEFEFEQARES